MINLVRFPYGSTADMKYWHITVEISRNDHKADTFLLNLTTDRYNNGECNNEWCDWVVLSEPSANAHGVEMRDCTYTRGNYCMQVRTIPALDKSEKARTDLTLRRIQTGLNDEALKTPLTVVGTVEELDVFYATKGYGCYLYSFESYYWGDANTSFKDAIAGFNEDYFRNNYLALFVRGGSSSVKYSLTSVDFKSKATIINIDVFSPSMQNDDIIHEIFLIEMSRDDVINGSFYINQTVNGKTPPIKLGTVYIWNDYEPPVVENRDSLCFIEIDVLPSISAYYPFEVSAEIYKSNGTVLIVGFIEMYRTYEFRPVTSFRLNDNESYYMVITAKLWGYTFTFFAEGTVGVTC